MQPPRRRPAASTSYDPLSDPELAHLSPSQVQRLDDAFIHAGESKNDRRDRKRRKVEADVPVEPMEVEPDEGGGGGFIVDDATDADMGGGFMVDDDDGGGGGFMVDDPSPAENDNDAGGGGGFVPEEGTSTNQAQPLPQDVEMSPPPPSAPTRTHLPLSLIPAALKLAGLPPADASVLGFFKQSAEGWDDAPAPEEEGGVKEKGVARRDWFAVCGILMASREEELGPEVQEEEEEEEEAEPLEVESAGEEDSEDAADVFQPEDDDDEDGGGFVRSPSNKAKGKGKLVLDEDDDGGDDVEFDIKNTSRRRTRRTAANVSPVPSLPSDVDLDEDADDSDAGPKKTNKGAAAASKPKPKPKKKAVAKRTDDSDDEPEQLTLSRAEKKHAKETFELLLGPAGVGKGKQVLEVREVGGAAKMLGEGWTIDEVSLSR